MTLRVSIVWLIGVLAAAQTPPTRAPFKVIGYYAEWTARGIRSRTFPPTGSRT